MSLELRVTSRELECKRVSYRKSRVYKVKPYQLLGCKRTIYFARNKIKGTDIVRSTNNVTSLTNRFPKLISLPTSTVFVSGKSESGFYFLDFFVSRPFKKYWSVNPIRSSVISVVCRLKYPCSCYCSNFISRLSLNYLC